MLHTIVFFYIFDFKLIKGNPLSASAIITGIILGLVLLFNKKKKKKYRALFRNHYHWKILMCWFLINLFSVAVTIAHQQYDFSFCKVLVHQIIIIEVGILLIAFIRMKNQQEKLLDIVIDIFIIQSLIIILSIISSPFRELTNIFREEHVIEKAYQSYANARGMAISGTAFFGLAVSYGTIFILISYHWDEWKYKSLFVRGLCLAILCVGAISAGRTSLIGVIVSILFCVAVWHPKRKRTTKKQKVTGLVFLISVLIVVALFMSSNQQNNKAVELLYKYSFEMINNFLEGNGLSSTSVNTLKSMYVSLSPMQLIVGDGRYTVQGLYYMNTDVGYLRGILYFGILGLLFLIYYQWQLLKVDSQHRKTQLFLFSIFFLVLIYELKGEVAGVLIMFQALILLIREAVQYKESSTIQNN